MDEALMELLDAKPFEFITVKEICARAGVNRSTFYLHYETVGDLLAETLETANRDFLSYYQQSAEGFIQKIAACPLRDLMLVTPEFLLPYLRFITEHLPVFRAAFSHPAAMRSEDQFKSLYTYVLDPILARFAVPPEERKYMVQFYIHGIMAVIRSWVLDPGGLDIDAIAAVITDCVLSHRRLPYEP